MKQIFASILGLTALKPTMAWAFDIPPPSGGGGAEGLAGYVGQIIPVLQILFVGVAFLMLVTYAGKMIVYSSQESSHTESKMAYLYLAVGGILVAVAGWAAQAFAPGIEGVGGQVVFLSNIEAPLMNAILYLKLALATALMVNIVLQSFRLISSEGEQAKVDRAKKRLFNSFVGVAVVLLANSIILSANPGSGSADLTYAIAEVIGLCNFLISLIGTGVIIAIIVAGVLLIFSVNESLIQKVKHIIFTCIFILVILLISYTLINFFLNVPVV